MPKRAALLLLVLVFGGAALAQGRTFVETRVIELRLVLAKVRGGGAAPDIAIDYATRTADGTMIYERYPRARVSNADLLAYNHCYFRIRDRVLAQMAVVEPTPAATGTP